MLVLVVSFFIVSLVLSILCECVYIIVILKLKFTKKLYFSEVIHLDFTIDKLAYFADQFSDLTTKQLKLCETENCVRIGT